MAEENKLKVVSRKLKEMEYDIFTLMMGIASQTVQGFDMSAECKGLSRISKANKEIQQIINSFEVAE